jgi:hypothetical protein
LLTVQFSSQREIPLRVTMAASMACAQDKENAVENIGDAVRNFADEVVFSLKNR